MRMTLKILKGLFLEEVVDYNPTYLGDLTALVNEGLRDLLRSSGGIPSNTSISTVADTWEYDTDSSFPSDFKAIHSCYYGNFPLDLIERKDRVEGSSGVPSRYYIWGESIGFDPCPNGVYSVTLYYYGLGSALSADADVALGTLPIMDDDPIWRAVTIYCAIRYWKSVRSREMQRNHWTAVREIGRVLREMSYESRELRSMAVRKLNSWNKDTAFKVPLPGDFFRQTRGSFEDRASNEGDLVRSW